MQGRRDVASVININLSVSRNNRGSEPEYRPLALGDCRVEDGPRLAGEKGKVVWEVDLGDN